MRYLVILASITAAFADLSLINTPIQIAAACSDVTVNWTGGVSPYSFLVLPGGLPSAAPFESFTGITGTQFTWHVIETAGTPVFLRIVDDVGARAESATFTILPGACCDSTPITTKAGATDSCLADDRSVTLMDATTCDFVTSLLGITKDEFYTVSGSNICCTSIPVGTTLCLPGPSTPSCPTTTTPTTTTTATDTMTSTTMATTTSTTTTAASTPSNVSGYRNWDYAGCFVDSVSNRVLPNPMGLAEVTVENCIDACTSAGYVYAGLEYSQECYCGIAAPPTVALDGRCDMTCKGNSQELCGGGDGLSVYFSGSAPSILQSYNSWTYTGCYEDSVAARTMPITVTKINADHMTVEKCLDACQTRGHLHAGLEWSQECYCADALPPMQATDGRCDMVCKGNDLEYCGGGNGLTVYSYSYSPVYSRRAF